MENMENAARKKVMLSGIQPSGDLTLGSYLGAIKNWAERDEEFDNYYFMADMHSITVRQDPAALCRRAVFGGTACGLDEPELRHCLPERLRALQARLSGDARRR